MSFSLPLLDFVTELVAGDVPPKGPDFIKATVDILADPSIEVVRHSLAWLASGTSYVLSGFLC